MIFIVVLDLLQRSAQVLRCFFYFIIKISNNCCFCVVC